MVTVKDKLDAIKALSDYVPGSVILKSCNRTGCAFKYLIDVSGTATRKEVFYQFDSTEIDTDLPDKTVLLDYMLDEAS